MKTKLKHTLAPLVVTFDGIGLNDCGNEYRPRIATFTEEYRHKKYGLYIARAVNAHEALLSCAKDLMNRMAEGSHIAKYVSQDFINDLGRAISLAEGKGE